MVPVRTPSSSVAGTLKPAGLENSIGVIVGTPNKDPNDPKWQQDAGVRAYRAFFEKYLAGADITNTSYLTGYQQGMLLERILNQCGNDLSRANILKQAKSLRDFVLPTTLPQPMSGTDGQRRWPPARRWSYRSKKRTPGSTSA